MHLRRSTLAAFLLAATACASSSGSNLPPSDVQYTGLDARSGRFGVSTIGGSDRPADAVLMDVKSAWAALPRAYAAVGLTPTVLDTAQMVLGVQGLVIHKPLGGERLSRLLDCGIDVTGPNADYYEVRLTVMSGVRAADDGSSALTTRVTAYAQANGQSSNVRCGSTGRLEEKIAAAINTKR